MNTARGTVLGSDARAGAQAERGWRGSTRAASRPFSPSPASRWSIGRDPGNQIFLGDTLASKRHAAVSFQGRRLIVEDLNSLNGTCVNERRVKAQELAPGDVIRIGRSLYIYLVDGMPLKRASGRAAGWLIGRSPTGGLKLPVTETPILIGRAPEADIRVAEHGICDFHVQVTRVARRRAGDPTGRGPAAVLRPGRRGGI